MSGDTGIGTGVMVEDLQDPDYRFQLYTNWGACLKSKTATAKQFCRNNFITQDDLEKIVREFDSFKDGE